MGILKKIVKILSIFLIFMILLAVLIHYFRIPLMENFYKVTDDEEVLVQYSVELVESDDYARMKKYLPLAADIEDFYKISKENEYYLDEFYNTDNPHLATLRTLLNVVAMSSLSYIFDEDYIGFQETFPSLYDKLLEERAYGVWLIKIDEQDVFTDEGYITIINALKKECPEKPEMDIENETQIKLYATNLFMQASVYKRMGELEAMNELNTEIESINVEYIKMTDTE